MMRKIECLITEIKKQITVIKVKDPLAGIISIIAGGKP
jgi:hypothetical protein